MDININEKRCSKCHEIKKVDSFGVKKFNKDGLNHYCKICENNRTKIRYNDPIQKEKVKYNQILRIYGLTKDDYISKLEFQNYKCGICDKELLNDKNTHIDHSHDNNNIRDILCRHCNFLLGQVNEDVKYLNNLISYINKHR